MEGEKKQKQQQNTLIKLHNAQNQVLKSSSAENGLKGALLSLRAQFGFIPPKFNAA